MIMYAIPDWHRYNRYFALNVSFRIESESDSPTGCTGVQNVCIMCYVINIIFSIYNCIYDLIVLIGSDKPVSSLA